MSAAQARHGGDELRRDEPLARHTSWRVGGPADVYFRPATRQSLLAFLAGLDPALPVHWLGLGSNLLVRDGGLRGVVIATSRALGTLQRLPGRVVAGAGLACTVLARRCARWGLGPAEFFAGIPGTVGGALRMNAGAFGGETWDRVIEVETVDRRGRVRRRPRDDFGIGYREVRGAEGEWFLAAHFDFVDQPEGGLERVRSLLREREQKQPLGLASCGSVFRNPPGDHAARLIESCGLKGLRIGGAEVSTKHANFIINTGGATAADIERLIETVRERVAAETGVQLVPEVHIVGEPGGAA
ncbi:MAG: UDP-N-acetylmuramate dehydrogenase [Gammaproteobacteria bacterium]|nr:MAG: UDP-N-acetylmuramate dehydrogenase [Gammaproteobacteria bacterium]